MSETTTDPNVTWPKHTVGLHKYGGDEAMCVLLHESPPDQEDVLVVLLDDFICLERGKVIAIQRHQFTPTCGQEDL